MAEDIGLGEIYAKTFRLVFVAIVIAVLVLFVAMAVIRVIYPDALPGLNIDVMQQHWPAVFGIPLCALLALFVVLLTTTMSGKITFEFGPMKLSSAAGESVIWLIGFFLAVWAFKELWVLPN